MSNALRVVKSYYPGVNKIVNAKEHKVVSITRGDVKSARRLDHNGCAVVEACKRIKDADGAIISKRTAYLIHGDTAERYEVPERVLREITSFDRGAQFTPGEYSLYKPHKKRSTTSGARYEPGETPKKRKLVMHHIEGVRPSLHAKAPKLLKKK